DIAADRIRNLLRHAFALVADAVDRLLLRLRDPDLLAALPRWALDADRVALAGAPDAAAAAGVPSPAAGLLDALLHDRAGDALDLRLPVAAADVDDLGVIDRLANHLRAGLHAGLIDRLADVDAVGLRLSRIDRLADRVANLLGMRCIDRLADCVADIT